MRNLDGEGESEIFKLQMYYMLLWSAIERYMKLKYDVSNTENDYLRALANDDVYNEAFSRVNPRNRDSIRSAKNASRYYFNKGFVNNLVF